MPDRRQHRGAHPRDAEGFSEEAMRVLRVASDDFCWLLGRDYPPKAALKLVGDRYRLRERQRAAVGRASAGDPTCAGRLAGRVDDSRLVGETVLIDGYNVLLTVETALGGGAVLLCRDHTLRDMSAMSRHYRRVNQTLPALGKIGEFLEENGCTRVRWYFDRPISNSGRLRGIVLEVAEERGWPWDVELVANPDPILASASEIVATADGGILDQGVRWINLARRVVEEKVPDVWWLDFTARP